MTWFKRQSGELDTSGEKKVRTEGLWVKCDNCRQIIWKKDLEDNFNVCPKCDKHFRIDARTRLAQLLDNGKYEVFDGNLASTDPLKFVDLKAYSSRLKHAKAETGLNDAIINAHGKLNGRSVIVSSMEYSFIGGSMGSVVGEAITRAIEKATEARTPLIIVSASGGARMMEGAISLMQLAKISSALARLDTAKVPFVSVLTDPPTDCVVCHARRSQHRGTWCADWFRRPAGDRADHPPETPAWLPALRVPAGARHARCCRHAQGDEGIHREGVGFHGGCGGVKGVGRSSLVVSKPLLQATYP
jgi:acetyl-CoA carboxylase carboxyl transferase subunit beta